MTRTLPDAAASAPARSHALGAVAIALACVGLALVASILGDLSAGEMSPPGRRTVTLVEVLAIANLLLVATLVFVMMAGRRAPAGRRASAARPAVAALGDPLTGLSNRHHLALECRDAATDRSDAAVLAVGLAIPACVAPADRDRVLGVLARRLRATVDTADLAARSGDLDLAVLVRAEGGAEFVRGLAERIVAALGQPVHVERRALTADVTVGAAPVRAGDDGEAAIARAERALERARSRGPGAISYNDAVPAQ